LPRRASPNRCDTIRKAGTIVVLVDGRIAEIGTREDLACHTREFWSLLPLTYLAFGGHGATIQRFNDFRQILSSNPCNLS